MAQDVIWFSPDRKIEGRVLEVSASAVKYKKESNLKGPVYVESKSEIVAIVYSNGDKDIWSNRVKEVSKDYLVFEPLSSLLEQSAQEDPETLAMKAAEEKKKKEMEAERQRQLAEQRAAEEARKAEAEAKKKAEDAAKAAAAAKNAFSANQGNPFGDPNSSNLSGGGKGQGNGCALSGRTIVGSLPKPVSSNNETGTVVVIIEVDASGKVVSAMAGGKGTNTFDTELWKASVAAAKKAKFNGISGNTIQTGTITYHFVNQ